MNKKYCKIKGSEIMPFIKCAIITGYIAHFRECIYRSLQSRSNMQVLICAKSSTQTNYIESGVKGKYPFKPIHRWDIHIPGTMHKITINPYLILSVILGKYKVIITDNYLGNFGLWISIVVSKILRQRIILWGHQEADTKMKSILRGLQFRLADAILFYTEGTRDAWIKMGIKPGKLFVAYNALDTDKIERVKSELNQETLQRFKIEQNLLNRKMLIYVGRLISAKKPLLMLEALNILKHNHPQTLLLIIGDGPLRSQMEDKVRELNLIDYVKFIGPLHDENLLAKYFLSSHIGVMPSFAGLFIQHAFGYGLPVITDDNISIHGPEIELLQDGVNGILYRKNDPRDFASAISRLLENDALRRSMGEMGYKLIKEKYNLENMRDGIFAAIDYCLKM